MMNQKLVFLNQITILTAVGLSVACGDTTYVDQDHTAAPYEAPHRNRERFLGTLEGSLKVCAAGPTTYGLDVSKWQGDIDWAKVAASGVKFVITRIAHGTGHDPYFESNWAAIKAHGMVRGAYQFYAPLQDTAAQAQEVIKSVGMLQPGDLPVVLDVEWTDGTPNAKEIQKWVDLVTQGTGKRPMIYTAVGYWNQFFTTEFKDLDLWVANWEATCPSIPAGWDNWLFWQTSGGGGTVPGIKGGVDENLFNGTLEDLHYVAGLPNFTNCSAIQSLNCGKFGCACADNTCSGGFCDGTGCSAKVAGDCGFFGCTCIDGVCNGGACPGAGCTAKQMIACSDMGHDCEGGVCKPKDVPIEDAGGTDDTGTPDEDAGAGDTGGGSADGAVVEDSAADTGGAAIDADPLDAGGQGDLGIQEDSEATADVNANTDLDVDQEKQDGGSFVIPSFDVGSKNDTAETDSTPGKGGIPGAGGQSFVDEGKSDDGGCSGTGQPSSHVVVWWLATIGYFIVVLRAKTNRTAAKRVFGKKLPVSETVAVTSRSGRPRQDRRSRPMFRVT
ncbi:MAG: hypothetical protein HUU55_18505 [Myxococcales bacterium]|nr:hypothetical protein [Myxococcales bacterium]